jgi:siderophore-iron reductase FhuF
MRSSPPAGPDRAGAGGRSWSAPGSPALTPPALTPPALTPPALTPAALIPAALTPAAGADVVAALTRAGSGNPLLGVGLDSERGVPADRLCVPGDDDGGRLSGTAADLLDRIATRLGGCERRVAASMVVLGYSARLVGPAVSMLLREDMLLDLRPSNVRFDYDPRWGFSLNLVRPAAWRGDRTAMLSAWCQVVLDEHLRAVIDAVRAVVPVAAALLWGNVASGLAGALRALANSATAASAAVPVDRCYADGLRLLEYGPLRGSGDLAIRSGRLSFVRRSCCLYYRLPGGGRCGDCPLPPGGNALPPGRDRDAG